MTEGSNAYYDLDLRGFIKYLEEKHPEEIFRVTKEVDPEFGVSGILHRLEADNHFRTVIFENVKGSDVPLVTNMHAGFERLSWKNARCDKKTLFPQSKLKAPWCRKSW
jgi:UbiD family decarboxylase